MGLWQWLAVAAGLLALVVIVVVAAAWPRDDEPADPDAVVVLGGAGPERVELGIELRDRYDAVLVLSSSAINFGREAGVDCQNDPAIRCLYPQPATTLGEARSVAQLADEQGWDHVTVATARFHSTRARVLFRQCLGDRVSVVGAPPRPGQRRGPVEYLNEFVGTLAAMTYDRAC
jgi:uncharacterized SAM-binding protein YcdF (DUF218 family)